MFEQFFDRYEELKKQYKISRTTMNINPDNFDIIIVPVEEAHSYTLYHVVKNKPGLCIRDQAIICDAGNLRFGYSMHGGLIKVYTD